MKIKSLNVGSINTNCYVVTIENETLIIDPGGDSDEIIKVIENKSLKPKLCLLTHAHFDHILAVVNIIKKYKIPLLLSKKDLFLLREGIDLGKVEKFIEFVDEKSSLFLGNTLFKIIETPGHTPGSVSLYNESKKVVFVGDLLFTGGFVGRTDFDYGDESVLQNSIKKILALPTSIRVYSGHGSSFLISDWGL